MRTPRVACLAALVLGALVCSPRASAQPEEDDDEEVEEPVPPAPPAAAPEDPGAELTVHVLTFSPGDHPFYKFGHNAIWIHDQKEGLDRVYNYGTFRFGSAALIPKFFLGRFQYSLSRGSLGRTISSYKRENRSIHAQELNLRPAERAELARRLEVNLQRENRYYKYDYYRDNCSTRVRDILDGVIGGRLRDAAIGPGELTYRQHTRRLTADLFYEYFALHIVMGGLIDKPTTVWEETFLPEKLEVLLRAAKVPGPQGDEPLVRAEQVLLTATRSPPPAAPPGWAPRFFAAGVAAGGVFTWLGRAGRTRRFARVLTGLLAAIVGLFFGFLGTAFVTFWAVAAHEVGIANENILQCAPWAILLSVFGVGVALGRPRATRVAYRLAAAAAIFAALGLALKALPWFYQDNWEILALMLPLWTGAALGLRALSPAAPDTLRSSTG